MFLLVFPPAGGRRVVGKVGEYIQPYNKFKK